VRDVNLQVQAYTLFDDLPHACRRLFDEAGQRNFFLTLDWFEHLSRTAMDEDQQLRIYNVSNPGDPEQSAGTFVGRASCRQQGLMPLRKLSAFTNYYSCSFAMHFPGVGERGKSMQALAAAIAAERPRWDTIEIQPLDQDSAEFSEMVAAFRKAGFAVQTYFLSGNWYLQVLGRTYEQYVKSLAPALRNTLRRKRKKLEESGRARIEIVTGGERLEEAIEAYTKVYLASWKRPEPYTEFIPGLIRLCARLGALRLGVLHVDGEPAASQLWIVHHGRALIYKLAYDERFADLSVGTVLTATLMQHVLDIDKVEEVDYLTGDDAYKKDWMSHRRERWGILAMNPRTPRGAVSILRNEGGRQIRRASLYIRDRLPKRTSTIPQNAAQEPQVTGLKEIVK
jgi:CelD/BcsL family acetyltransferase involved in cellulose biosynthesis